jgi:hypothetical protein
VREVTKLEAIEAFRKADPEGFRKATDVPRPRRGIEILAWPSPNDSS